MWSSSIRRPERPLARGRWCSELTESSAAVRLRARPRRRTRGGAQIGPVLVDDVANLLNQAVGRFFSIEPSAARPFGQLARSWACWISLYSSVRIGVGRRPDTRRSGCRQSMSDVIIAEQGLRRIEATRIAGDAVGLIRF